MIPVALWLLLAGTVAGLPTNEEMMKALEPWTRCLQTTAARLDDGHTEFYVLGKDVTETCHPVFEKITESIIRKLVSPDDQKNLRNGFIYDEAGAGNVAIMRHRLSQRPTPHKP